jgi:hypothetical protein
VGFASPAHAGFALFGVSAIRLFGNPLFRASNTTIDSGVNFFNPLIEHTRPGRLAVARRPSRGQDSQHRCVMSYNIRGQGVDTPYILCYISVR